MAARAIWPKQQRSIEIGLPLFVCNRTGVERDFDMRQAESVVVSKGKKLLAHTAENSSVVVLEWSLNTHEVVHSQGLILDLPLS